MKIGIKNNHGMVLFSHDVPGNTLRTTVEAAVKAHASLTGASLTGACLIGVDLIGVDLTGVDLTGVDLTGACLAGACLTGANLTNADLTGADLTCANLTCANLTDANLTDIREDIWAVLSTAPNEVAGLIDALKSGRVDGSAYRGECACLVGTIANIRHIDYNKLSPDPSRPAEIFFLGIREGDTPDTNPLAKLAVQWCEEWIMNNNGI